MSIIPARVHKQQTSAQPQLPVFCYRDDPASSGCCWWFPSCVVELNLQGRWPPSARACESETVLIPSRVRSLHPLQSWGISPVQQTGIERVAYMRDPNNTLASLFPPNSVSLTLNSVHEMKLVLKTTVTYSLWFMPLMVVCMLLRSLVRPWMVFSSCLIFSVSPGQKERKV